VITFSGGGAASSFWMASIDTSPRHLPSAANALVYPTLSLTQVRPRVGTICDTSCKTSAGILVPYYKIRGGSENDATGARSDHLVLKG
jgi:hypothetical protein